MMASSIIPTSPDPAANACGSGQSKSSSSSSANTTTVEQQRYQDRRVCYIRAAVILVLVAATTIVATFAGWIQANEEHNKFEMQYKDSVAKLGTDFQRRINSTHSVAKTFSATITSRYGNTAQAAMGLPPLWPNVTIPDFQEQTVGSLAIVDGRAISWNPIITQNVNRKQWEAYTTESISVFGNESAITAPLPNSKWPDNRTISFGIYSRHVNNNVIYDPGYSPNSTNPNIMVPVWQIAPIKTNEKAVMFNLHSEFNRMQALDYMIDFQTPTLTAILQLVQDKIQRPSSILFYPVFDTFGSSVGETNHEEELGKGGTNQKEKVVGSVSIVFSWDTLLNKILPDYIKGMVCVLQSSTGQVFSYTISGDVVTFLGEGDQHDSKYDTYGHHVTHSGMMITYKLHMYPSEEFQAQYVTKRRGVYAAGAVLIFLFTAGMFLLYDYLVEDRQKRLARLARSTGNIVDAMFPAAFRERTLTLYKVHGNENHRSVEGNSSGNAGDQASSSHSSKNRRSSVLSGSIDTDGIGSEKGISSTTNPRRLSSMVNRTTHLKVTQFIKKGLRTNDPNENDTLLDDQGRRLLDEDPIADLYHDTSIMFSDIVGFTKWSSERSPHEVFQLLEQIFWEFDDLAARYNVFKLGTIGDCYIAVTGIPEPMNDHATVLTQFAFDCRDKVRDVFTRLDCEGLHSSHLDMRFGIHSGDTTAGILRGTKSRFELFGDTINTASRMESTGIGGKIQVSEETAHLLRQDDKSRWLRKRDMMVTAKGKGQLQTYWVEPERTNCRVSFSGIDGLDIDNTDNIQHRHRYSSGEQLSNLEEKVEDEDELDAICDYNSAKMPPTDENV